VKKTPPNKMTMTQARKYLGVSFTKLTSLVASGKIPYEVNPLDHRVKLIKRSDLDTLLRRLRDE
jgi:hypothetical protein